MNKENFEMVAVLLVILKLYFMLAMTTSDLGPCPTNIGTVKNFNIQPFLGRWNVHSHYSSMVEMESRCDYDNYTLLPDGEVLMENSKIYKPNLTHSAIGKGHIVGPGKLSVRYAKLAASIGLVDYWILDTDYENYAVVYSCYNFSQVHTKFVWILMRHRSLTEEQMEAARNIIDTNLLEFSALVESDQENCTGFS